MKEERKGGEEKGKREGKRKGREEKRKKGEERKETVETCIRSRMRRL